VRLNRNTGEWDWDALANCFDVGELLEWGFTEDELQFWVDEPTEGLIDDDEVPEVEEAITQQGDLWILGEHRLLCGDATKKEDVEMLMDGQKADLTLADPPYNLGYEYNSYDDNKEDSEYESFCSAFFQLSKTNSDKQIITTGKKNLGLWYKISDIKDFAIWYASNKMSGGRVSNLALCEPIIFVGEFNRDARQNDFYEYNVKQQLDTGDHTCPKIIDLWLDLVNCYSNKNIYDPFLGSGSTLIACEKTNRKCYGMEIDPHYCDVIVKRWEDYTGKKAERVEAASA
jgi:DNA modification methylase